MDGWMENNIYSFSEKLWVSSFIDSHLHFHPCKGKAKTGSKACNSDLVATKHFYFFSQPWISKLFPKEKSTSLADGETDACCCKRTREGWPHRYVQSPVLVGSVPLVAAWFGPCVPPAHADKFSSTWLHVSCGSYSICTLGKLKRGGSSVSYTQCIVSGSDAVGQLHAWLRGRSLGPSVLFALGAGCRGRQQWCRLIACKLSPLSVQNCVHPGKLKPCSENSVNNNQVPRTWSSASVQDFTPLLPIV